MTADERRGLRLALLGLALSAVLGAVLSLWFLAGYPQAVTLLACSGAWIAANLGLLAMAPRKTKRPRRTEGV